jgi:hypothetical protein
MSRQQFRGIGALVWCATISNKAAPTAAEVAAGVRLTSQLTNDGLDTPRTGKTIDIADASDLFDKTAPGSYGGDTGKLTCYRDTKTALDLAYSTLVDGAVGFLVVFRFGCAQDANGKGTPSGTATVGDRCEVWPATIISRAPMPIGDGKATTFDVSIAFTDSPNTDALVA